MSGEQLRISISLELDRRPARYLSTVRTDRADFIVEARGESSLVELADALVAARLGVRVGLGRAASMTDLPNSVAGARASLTATDRPVASYRDLGSGELLSLPDDTLRAFVEQVLEGAADDEPVMESLTPAHACQRLHPIAQCVAVDAEPLRGNVPMERLKERTGRDPEDPDHRLAP